MPEKKNNTNTQVDFFLERLIVCSYPVNVPFIQFQGRMGFHHILYCYGHDIPIVNGEDPYSLYLVNPPHIPPNNIIMVGLNYNQYHPTLMINNLIN